MSDLHPEALTLDDSLWDDTPVPLDQLLALQSGLNAPDIIKRLRVVLPDHVDASTLDAAGFVVARTTRLLDLALPHPSLADADLPDGFDRMWQGPAADCDWDGWCAAHWAHYARTHRGNPPRHNGANNLRDLFIGDDLVDALFVHNTQGDLRGFASLRDGCELGWIGTWRPEDSALAGPLLAVALRRAAALGWPSASWEVDDDDPDTWALIPPDTAPASRTYLTWVWDRPVR